MAPRKKTGEPTVTVFLPLREDPGIAANVAESQQETVVINGKASVIRRGEYVEVPVNTFLQLRNRFPQA